MSNLPSASNRSSNSPKPLQSSLRTQATPQEAHATEPSIHATSQNQDEEAISDDGDGYPPVDTENTATSLLPPPNFNPLFTVITDPQTRETYHPSIYYVFSDDAENEREGNDVATVAALRALDQSAQRSQQQYERDQPENQEELEERFIIVNMETVADSHGTGLRIGSASSLSPSWAVNTTTLRSAPTFDQETEENAGSLMLQIEGIELAESDVGNNTVNRHGKKMKKEESERKAAELLQQARKRGGGGVVQGMEEIWKGLTEGVGVLEKVMGDEL